MGNQFLLGVVVRRGGGNTCAKVPADREGERRERGKERETTKTTIDDHADYYDDDDGGGGDDGDDDDNDDDGLSRRPRV